MKYRIISVGRIREKFYDQGVQEYLKRLGPYTNIELIDGLEAKVPSRAGEKDIEKILQREGERILALLNDNELLVVWDVRGKPVSSGDLAKYLNTWNQSGLSRVNMVIGSSHGLSSSVRQRADYIMSFSNMTFPHQMAVLILAEQIYRGFKILKGEPYHK